MSTWAEDINAHRAAQRATPSVSLPHKHFTRASGLGTQMHSRDFSIINNSSVNEEGAASYRSTVEAKTKRALARAVEKELGKNGPNPFNVITMEPRFGMSVSQGEELLQKKSEVTDRGKKIDKAHFNTTIQEALDETKVHESSPQRQLNAHRPKARQTNIINHRYVENHSEKVQLDEQRQRDYVNFVSSAMNGFNPLTQKHCHQDKEAVAVKKKLEKESDLREKVASHTYKVSQLVERSEGHAFNILTNKVFNPNYVLKWEADHCKGIPQRAELKLQWEHQRDAEEAVRDVNVERALNRVSQERQFDEMRRKYDILSNKPFAEDLSTAKASPSTAAPLRPMSTLVPKSVMSCLGEKSGEKSWSTSEVYRTGGPRSSQERVFNSASPLNAEITTFAGRRRLLLPALKLGLQTSPVR